MPPSPWVAAYRFVRTHKTKMSTSVCQNHHAHPIGNGKRPRAALQTHRTMNTHSGIRWEGCRRTFRDETKTPKKKKTPIWGSPKQQPNSKQNNVRGADWIEPPFPFPFFRTERMGDKQLGRQATNASADRTPPAPSTTAQKEKPRARGRPGRTADVREQRYFSHVKKVRRSVTVTVTVTVTVSTDPFPPSYPIPYFFPLCFLTYKPA